MDRSEFRYGSQYYNPEREASGIYIPGRHRKSRSGTMLALAAGQPDWVEAGLAAQSGLVQR